MTFPEQEKESWYLSYHFQVFLLISTVVLINILYTGLSADEDTVGEKPVKPAAKIGLLIALLCFILFNVYTT